MTPSMEEPAPSIEGVVAYTRSDIIAESGISTHEIERSMYRDTASQTNSTASINGSSALKTGVGFGMMVALSTCTTAERA